jgi:hypothetical protein
MVIVLALVYLNYVIYLSIENKLFLKVVMIKSGVLSKSQ